MADDNDSANSWPGFVGQLNKSFNLVRDVFGYALPGAAFLAIGLISKRFSLSQVQALLSPYQMPAWMAFIAIIAGCYLVGDVLASISYMLFMLAKYAVWMLDRYPTWVPWMWDRRSAKPASSPIPPAIHEHIERRERSAGHEFSESLDLSLTQPSHPAAPNAPQEPADGTWRAWLFSHPTEVPSEILRIHQQRPKLIDILDRRETQNLMSASLTGALLAGWYVFCYKQVPFSTIIFWAAVITSIQFLTGLPHLRRVTKAIYAADKALAEEEKKNPKNDPDFSHLLAQLLQAATAAVKKIS